MRGHLQKDVYQGIALLVFSVLMYFIIVPWQVPLHLAYTGDTGVSPRTFPRTAIIGLFVVCMIYTLKSLFKPRKLVFENGDGALYDPKGNMRIIIFLIILSAYVGMIHVLGYLVSTPIFIFSLACLYGERRWLLLSLTSIATTISLWIFFRYLLYLVFPTGIF